MSTTHGPGNNCYEAGEGYFNPAMMAVSNETGEQTSFTNGFYIYNLCGSPAYYIMTPLDDNFVHYYVGEYAGNSDGLPQIVSQTQYETGNYPGWHLLLYDVPLNQYDDFLTYGYQGSNTFEGGEGWSLFETHFGPGITCPLLPDMNTEGLRFYSSSTGWTGLANSNSYTQTVGYNNGTNPSCFSPTIPPYYSMSYSSESWLMNDPAPTPKPAPTPTKKPCTGCACSSSTADHRDVACPQLRAGAALNGSLKGGYVGFLNRQRLNWDFDPKLPYSV